MNEALKAQLAAAIKSHGLDNVLTALESASYDESDSASGSLAGKWDETAERIGNLRDWVQQS